MAMFVHDVHLLTIYSTVTLWHNLSSFALFSSLHVPRWILPTVSSVPAILLPSCYLEYSSAVIIAAVSLFCLLNGCTVICKHSSGTHHVWTTRQHRTVISLLPVSCLDGPATALPSRRTVRGHRRYPSRYSHCMRVSHLLMFMPGFTNEG